MKAAILYQPRDVRVESVRPQEPRPWEVRIRVKLAGLCGTDYRIWTGDRAVTYPRVMGHEFVGVVDAIGPGVTQVSIGERVVVEPNYSCGRCPLCREGNRNLCLSRTAVGIDVDGCFAEMAQVPADRCWPVPVGVLDETAVITEPLAVVVRAVNRAATGPGQTAAVIGAGTLGLLALQVLRARGVRVLVVSRTARRLPLARELGADTARVIAAGPLENLAREFSGREGVDVVVETAGTAQAVEHAVLLVRPGGRVVLTGLPHEPTSLSFFSVVRREITITGSMIYQGEFPEALKLLETGAVTPARLITQCFPLEAIDEAFAAHRESTSLKVTVAP